MYIVLKWKIQTTYQSHIYESIDLNFGKLDYITPSTNLAKFCNDRISGGAPTWWWNMRVTRLFLLLLLSLFFLFLDTCTACTREPIFTHNSSKDADWLKEVPSKQVFLDIFTFWGYFPQNSQNFAANRETPAQTKNSNNSYAVEDRHKVSIEHKLGVSLSESVIENYARHPLAEISLWRHFRFARKRHYLGNDAK